MGWGRLSLMPLLCDVHQSSNYLWFLFTIYMKLPTQGYTVSYRWYQIIRLCSRLIKWCRQGSSPMFWIHGGCLSKNRLQFNPGKIKQLQFSTLTFQILRFSIFGSERDCNLGVLLDSRILLKEKEASLTRRAFSQLFALCVNCTHFWTEMPYLQWFMP